MYDKVSTKSIFNMENTHHLTLELKELIEHLLILWKLQLVSDLLRLNLIILLLVIYAGHFGIM
jgi:hypothetical protein